MSNLLYNLSLFHLILGWGYPSNGQSEAINHCQADKSWNLTSIEDCVLLPCPKPPPNPPVGGWWWYDLQNTRYKCPNGFMFETDESNPLTGAYPWWYSNCTVAKLWDPPETAKCIRKYFTLGYFTNRGT